jgi:hypothetical protein
LFIVPASQSRAQVPVARDIPSPALVEIIEKAIEPLPCVVKLSRWDRYYRYDFRSQPIDRNLILFILIETDGASKRRIDAPDDVFDTTEKPVRVTTGVFDRRNNAATIEQCNIIADPPVR